MVTPFKKTQETIQEATKQLGESSTILLVGVGVAVFIATIALVVAVTRK